MARLDGVELDVHVRGWLGGDLVRLVDEASRIDEVDSVERPAAEIALVPSSILCASDYQKRVDEYDSS